MKNKEVYTKVYDLLKSCDPASGLDSEHKRATCMVGSILRHLERVELFGFDFRYSDHPSWVIVSENQKIGLFGKNDMRAISWPDDGRQPKDEWLYLITYPAGPYIFGDQYPQDTFNAMWEELKSYGPEYIDTRNNKMYFTPEKAKFVHAEYKNIFNKYRAMVEDELKRIRKKKLEEELARLNNEDES